MIAAYNKIDKCLEIYRHKNVDDNEKPLWKGLIIPPGICCGFMCVPDQGAMARVDEEAFEQWKIKGFPETDFGL